MKRNLHLLLLLAVALIAVNVAKAQKRIVKGIVKDSATQQPLADVMVSDAFAKELAHTGKNGFFDIKMASGQTVFFDAVGYRYDTLHLAIMTPDTVVIYMAPLPNELAGITVTTIGYTRYQHDSLKRRQDFVDAAGPKTPTFAKSNTDAGIAVNLDPLFKKSERGRNAAYKQFDEIERTNYVDYRFPRELVASYTGLKDDDLSNFIEKYRPSYNWLRNHTSDDDVFYYINDKLKSFLKHKK